MYIIYVVFLFIVLREFTETPTNCIKLVIYPNTYFQYTIVTTYNNSRYYIIISVIYFRVYTKHIYYHNWTYIITQYTRLHAASIVPKFIVYIILLCRAKWKLCKIERVYYNIITNVGQITRGGGCQYRLADRWVYCRLPYTEYILLFIIVLYIHISLSSLQMQITKSDVGIY